MARIGVLAAILLVLVVARVPDAWSRVLMADGRGGGKHDSEKVSPSPTPNPSPGTNVSESSPKPQKKSHRSPSPATNSTTGSPKASSPSDNSTNVAPSKNVENGKKAKGRAGPTKSRIPTDKGQVDSCHASSSGTCHFHELIACLQDPKNDSKGLFLLVQNTGENNKTLKINDVKTQIAKGNISRIQVNALKGLVFLNVEEENCALHTKAASSDWNPLQQLPAYATHLTPIYGAYFLFVTMIISGGTWACCKFRRGRRANTGIPYQQLEMGTQAQSTSAVVDSNPADGWDEGWDEDWDEEEAAPQPSEKHTTGSVSANGLTSRSPRKDGWDVDWDD